MAGVLRGSQLAARLAPRGAAQLQQTRSYAGGHHGPPQVDFWKDPKNPANWKSEQTVLLILGGWAVVIKGAMVAFGK